MSSVWRVMLLTPGLTLEQVQSLAGIPFDRPGMLRSSIALERLELIERIGSPHLGRRMVRWRVTRLGAEVVQQYRMKGFIP